jgi:gamma-glutamyltranspeptidase/glutathione hydrolase
MRGLIAAGGPETAAAGAEILEAGGNAVDAVVSAMITAFIAEPCLTSPGGAGIATLYDQETDCAQTIDFFAAVPGLPAEALDATSCDFTALEVSFGSGTTQTFHVGRGATAVPGCLPGLIQLHQLRGKLPLADLLKTPQRLAEESVAVSATQAGFFEILTPILTYTEGISQLFAPKGRIARTGERVRSPLWSKVLAWIRRHHQDPLSQGPLREELLQEWGPPHGLLTSKDLDRYQPQTRPALRVPYRGHEVLLPAFPSVGGSMVGFALRLLEGLPMPEDAESPEAFHHLGAALEIALQARAASPNVASPEDLGHWLEEEHVSRYRPHFENLLRCSSEGGEGNPGLVPGNTTHISVIDSQGLAVSMTTSNGESCGEILPSLGLGMNNFLGEEDINPLGWHQGKPGGRLSTMMCPTLVKSSQGSLMSLGTGGSNRIRSAVLQTLVNLLDHQMPPKEAVHFPRIHRELGGFFMEKGDLPAATLERLQEIYPGARLHSTKGVFFGGVHMACLHQDGTGAGAGDPRRGGVVEVVEDS